MHTKKIVDGFAPVHCLFGMFMATCGPLVLLAMCVGCGSVASGVSEDTKRDAVRYVELDAEMHKERRLVLTLDIDRNPREVSMHADRAKALTAEMEAIKSKYGSAKEKKQFEQCVSEARESMP